MAAPKQRTAKTSKSKPRDIAGEPFVLPGSAVHKWKRGPNAKPEDTFSDWVDKTKVAMVLRSLLGCPDGEGFTPNHIAGLDLAIKVLEAVASGEPKDWKWIDLLWDASSGFPSQKLLVRNYVEFSLASYRSERDASYAQPLLKSWGAVGNPYDGWEPCRALIVRRTIVVLARIRPEFESLDPSLVDRKLASPANVGADSIAAAFWRSTFPKERVTNDAFKKARLRKKPD